MEAVARYYRFFLHKCPFCGTRFNRFLNKCNGYALLACPHCSLAYVAPSPAHSELDRIYSSAGYYEETIWGGGMTAQSYEDAMRGREWLLREIQFDRYEKRLGEEKRMLEIGSFDGSHLQLFKNRGWQVEGLEIVASIAQKAINRGIITYTKRLEDEHLQRARYDFVTMNHTLEHIHNPGIVMREVWGILKPSGRLIIQVPQEKPSYQPGGQHLLFFTAESMKRLLILSGFEVLALISKQHYNVNVKMDWIELNAYVEKRAA
ncbi:MAG: methyltransferase domain-containing protein [Candidatus Aureabacteria bacterium]|nr:methyltransferase domain-containing protein [Candidatus Auribacterota bacterium]